MSRSPDRICHILRAENGPISAKDSGRHQKSRRTQKQKFTQIQEIIKANIMIYIVYYTVTDSDLDQIKLNITVGPKIKYATHPEINKMVKTSGG